MCKHVAAVLFGVGTRVDDGPELLFRLRAVDEKDLVADKARPSAEPITRTRPLDGSPIRKASKRVRDPKTVKRKGKQTVPKPELELIPDRFVKWWK